MMHNFPELPRFLTFLYHVFLFIHQQNAYQVSKDGQLDRIHQITTNEAGLSCIDNQYELVPIPVPIAQWQSLAERAGLAASLIQDTAGIANKELIYSTLRHLLKESSNIDEVHLPYGPYLVNVVHLY